MATYLAREGFAFTSRDGMPRLFGAGSPIDSNDPDFKGREHLFQPAEDAASMATSRRGLHPNRATETATAGPGEQRVRTRPPEHTEHDKADQPKPGPRPDAK